MTKRWFILILLLISVSSFFSCSGKKAKPHILLITVDTLRSDHLGAYGYPRETSPFIDSLAKKGMVFKHAITPQPITAPSHATILSSLHPLTHGLTMNGQKLNQKVQTMAEVLQKDGYFTIATVSVKLLSSKNKFAQGFDSFSDQWNINDHANDKHQRTAPSVNQSLFKQIDDYLANPQHNKKPLFVWVHYFDPHFPYITRDHIQFKNKLPQKDNNKFIKNYDTEIRYTDEHIQKLYHYFEEKELSNQLLTCLTADHGEELGEHGHGHSHPDFYSETTFVPLILHGPGIPKNKTIDTYVSSMDIAETLLKQAGSQFDYATDGSNLLDLKTNQKNKKFLVIGNPLYARSLQLIGKPYSFIMNFDYHYKNWYISGSNSISEESFQSFPSQKVKVKEDRLVIPLPHSFKKGRNYLILRADIKQPGTISVDVKVRPYIFSGIARVPGHIKQLNIIYPITTRDGLVFHLIPHAKNPAQYLDNFRYTIISSKEFSILESQTLKTFPNQIYRMLMTRRKKHRKNELFNLETDMAMQKNLIKQQNLKPIIMKYKKLIYPAFKYYFLKRDKMLRGEASKSTLSDKEKEMLKSLGYL
jgi:arylsulfatase A-like enzyme